jgi:iron(III) transport system substrate-binding protein
VPAAFKARYGMDMEYLGGRGGDLINRLRTERAAGQYTFPIKVIPTMPDFPASVSSGSGIASLFNNAPHPNAARLLVNWLAPREGMLAYCTNEGNVPTRNDVDDSWAPDYSKPQPGVDYFDNQSWEFATGDKAGITKKIKGWLGQ